MFVFLSVSVTPTPYAYCPVQERAVLLQERWEALTRLAASLPTAEAIQREIAECKQRALDKVCCSTSSCVCVASNVW